MENIQAQVGSPKDGVFMQRAYELSPDDMDPDQIQANSGLQFKVFSKSNISYLLFSTSIKPSEGFRQ